MNEEIARLIDAKMRLEFQAKPAGMWLKNEDGNLVRLYQSAHQGFSVTFRPDTDKITVYSFDAEYAI